MLSNPTKTYAILPVPADFITSPQDSYPRQQHILWIGCSDSLISETDCLDVNRDEIFVHRNLGPRVSNGDLSSGSALEWSVDLLRVDHIVVCGHYDCSVTQKELVSEMLGDWDKDVKKHDPEARRPSNVAETAVNERSMAQRFEEAHVLEEVDWLRSQAIVKDAIEDRGLEIYAFVYDREKNSCVRLVEE